MTVLPLLRDREPLGGDLAQLAPGHEEHVGFLDQPVGDAVVAPEQSRAQRIGAGDRPLAGHGVGDGYGLRAGKRAHVVRGLRDVHAAPAQQERPLCAGQQLRRARQVIGGRPAADGRRRLAARIDGERLLLEGERAVADILRHRHHHWARPAGGGNLEGAPDQLGDAGGLLDAQQLLARRAQDLDLPRLLRHVLARMHAIGVADEGDNRRAGVERLDQAGGEVGGAGAQRGIDQPDAARHLGVGVGRERAAALVVDEVVVELQPPRRVVERQQLEPTHAEHRS